MAEERDNYVYIVEADLKAVAKAVRRRRILVFAPIPAILGAVGLAAIIAWFDDRPLSLFDLLPSVLLVAAAFAGAVYYAVPRIKKTSVMIGGDFIDAPLLASPRYTTTVKYKDMTAVKIDVVKDHIAGATIAAGGVVVCTGRIKDPGIVVRAIFERAPEDIRWRRSRWPHRRLSREEVKELIEKAHVPDINSLLPPSRDFMRAEDLYSQDRQEERIPGIGGWLERLFGGGTYKTGTMTSLEIPTPVTRYVNLMLVQMLKEGTQIRILRRSEPLPALTIGSEAITAPPLGDVLDRLKLMSNLDPRTRRTPIESTIRIMFKDGELSAAVPHKVVCQFDDRSDACCQIRVERLAE